MMTLCECIFVEFGREGQGQAVGQMYRHSMCLKQAYFHAGDFGIDKSRFTAVILIKWNHVVLQSMRLSIYPLQCLNLPDITRIILEMKICTYKQYSAVCFHLHWSGSQPLITHN